MYDADMNKMHGQGEGPSYTPMNSALCLSQSVSLVEYELHSSTHQHIDVFLHIMMPFAAKIF